MLRIRKIGFTTHTNECECYECGGTGEIECPDCSGAGTNEELVMNCDKCGERLASNEGDGRKTLRILTDLIRNNKTVCPSCKEKILEIDQ